MVQPADVAVEQLAQLADLAAKAADEGASVLDHFRCVRTLLMAQLAATTEAGEARGRRLWPLS